MKNTRNPFARLYATVCRMIADRDFGYRAAVVERARDADRMLRAGILTTAAGRLLSDAMRGEIDPYRMEEARAAMKVCGEMLPDADDLLIAMMTIMAIAQTTGKVEDLRVRALDESLTAYLIHTFGKESL